MSELEQIKKDLAPPIIEPVEPVKDRMVVSGINENVLQIYRGGRITPVTIVPNFVSVRRDGPWVLIALNDKVCQLTTTQAHDTACSIMYLIAECEAWEYIVFRVNGECFNLPHDNAESLSKGLLRKADRVDDFQIHNKVRILK